MSRRKRYAPPSPIAPVPPDKKQDSNQPINSQVVIACAYIQKAKDEVRQLNAQQEREAELLKELINRGKELLGDGA
jgi:hypothetical protein